MYSNEIKSMKGRYMRNGMRFIIRIFKVFMKAVQNIRENSECAGAKETCINCIRPLSTVSM